MKPGNQVLAYGMAAIVLLFAILATVLYRCNALVFTGTDPNSKVVAATLALVGSFLAAVVTLVGALLKHSLDVRSEARRDVELERNAALAHEAEGRLRLEAVIRAVELFGNQTAPALPIQRAGALIALTSLDQHALALALVAELLRKCDLEATTAAHVIDQALLSEDASIRGQAVDVLYEFAETFITTASLELPRCLLDNRVVLQGREGQCAASAVLRLIMARPFVDWQNRYMSSVAGIIRVLINLYNHEPHAELKENIGAALYRVLLAFNSVTSIGSGSAETDLSLLRKQLQQARSQNSIDSVLIEQLTQWQNASAQAAPSA